MPAESTQDGHSVDREDVIPIIARARVSTRNTTTYNFDFKGGRTETSRHSPAEERSNT